MPDDFGSFTAEEIQGIALDLKVPEAAGASPTDRFVRQISELVSLRFTAGENKGISIILCSDALESDVEGQDFQRFPLLRNGQDAISQKIFVSNAALGLAYEIPTNKEVADELAAVQKVGLGKLPALIVDWRAEAPRATLFFSGVDNPDDIQDVLLMQTDITPDDMKAGLDEFYTKRLRTPSLVVQGHSSSIWGESTKGWPAERPEEKIQGVLVSFLLARYSRFVVRAEVPTEDGRLDIKIFAKLYDAKGDKIVKNVWVLELKALNDKTSSGGTVSATVVSDAIQKGLTQAISYKDADHVNQAALCCFDMRATDFGDTGVFSDIAQEANDNGVHLWRWFLYRTAEASRNAKRTERISANSGKA